jgi:hypothetical protein
MLSAMASRTAVVERPPLDEEVEWNETAGMAERRMRISKRESLMVVADGRPIGRLTRRDIERCANHGNWLDAVMVRDLVNESHDTCN